MSYCIIPFRPVYKGFGTTDRDLRSVAAFMRSRPGWMADEVSGRRGEYIVLHTRPGGPAWAVKREADALKLYNEDEGAQLGPFKDMKELLIELYEMQADADALT